MTEMIGHIAETAGHDEPKTRSVTMDRNPRSRCRNHRSRWSEIRKKAQGKAGRIAASLQRMDLVILDELGYLPFSQAGGALLFHLLSKLAYFGPT